MKLGVPDASTVTPQGVRKSNRIDGVSLRRTVAHPDERGEVTEIFNPEWGIVPEPCVHVYQTMMRPG